MFEPYVADLKEAAKENEYFRKVVFTGARSQLVLMSLSPSEDIGNEVHEVDQTLYIVKGLGKAVLDGVESELGKGTVVCVPAGVHHNIINSDQEAMKLFTVYSPPEHAAGAIHKTKAEAELAEGGIQPEVAAK